jgi:hypothetical protein
MANTRFRQCRMSKEGFQDEVAWIPEKFAEVGKVIDTPAGEGWKVDCVGKEGKTDVELRLVRDEHRRYRQEIDV